MTSAALADHWPFFNLRVCTPRIELRYPSDDDLASLLHAATSGIHPPDFMPFNSPWTQTPSPQREWDSLKHYWSSRATLSAQSWALPFAIVVDGAIAGVQALMGASFAQSREVSTGSWLAMAHQGRGIGKEMRQAVLHLAFAGLGAESAISGAFIDNPASIAVSRALGYRDDGFSTMVRNGERARQLRLRLEHDEWERRRRDDIVIAGLAPCLPLLGCAP